MPSAPNPTAVNEPPKFHCRSQGCTKSFRRRDYRDRHELNHAHVPTYRCDICFRRYHRPDVLSRHVKGHEAKATADGSPGAGPSASRVPRKRRMQEELPETSTVTRSTTASPVDIAEDHTPQSSGSAPSRKPDTGKRPSKALARLIGHFTDSSIPSRPPWHPDDPGRSVIIHPVLHADKLAVPEHLVTQELRLFVLSLLEDTVQHENELPLSLSQIQTSFELFFVHFDPIYPIIHRPSLSYRKDQFSPHLLLSIAIIGSTFASQRGMYKFVCNHLYRILERCVSWALRLSLPDTNHHLLQAALLLNYFGIYWAPTVDHYAAILNHASLTRQLQFTGYYGSNMPSTNMGWLAWAEFEERKRLALFALCCDTQLASFFGHPPSVAFLQVSVDNPCADQPWRCPSAPEWEELLLRQGGLEEFSLRTCFGGFIHGEAMHPATSGIFHASVLIHGLHSLAYPLYWVSEPTLDLSGEDLDRGSFQECFGVLMWSWHIAFRTSFSSVRDNRGDCEFMYHVGLICKANMSPVMLRIAAGEERVAYMAIEPWQRIKMRALLMEWSQSPRGAFAAWHAVQIMQNLFEQSLDEHSLTSPAIAWCVYLAILVLWFFGITSEGLPQPTMQDRLCCWTDDQWHVVVEPRLARKSAVAYLTQYKPYAKSPGDCLLVHSKNNLIGLVAYGIHLFGSLEWELANVPYSILTSFIRECM